MVFVVPKDDSGKRVSKEVFVLVIGQLNASIIFCWIKGDETKEHRLLWPAASSFCCLLLP